MRTILLIISVLLMTPILHAQLGKGQWIVGGNANFDNYHQKSEIPGFPSTTKTTTIKASEGFGYFFMERLAGGFRFIQNYQKSKTVLNARESSPLFLYYEGKEKINGIGVSPFVRYYFLPSTKKVNILGEVNFAYLSNKSVIKTYQVQGDPNDAIPDQASQSKSTQKNKLNTWGIAAGPAFFLNPKVSLEITVGYSFSNDSETKADSHSIIGGIGFQIHLGK